MNDGHVPVPYNDFLMIPSALTVWCWSYASLASLLSMTDSHFRCSIISANSSVVINMLIELMLSRKHIWSLPQNRIVKKSVRPLLNLSVIFLCIAHLSLYWSVILPQIWWVFKQTRRKQSKNCGTQNKTRKNKWFYPLVERPFDHKHGIANHCYCAMHSVMHGIE